MNNTYIVLQQNFEAGQIIRTTHITFFLKNIAAKQVPTQKRFHKDFIAESCISIKNCGSMLLLRVERP